MWELRQRPADHPDSARLVDEVQEFYSGLYGGRDATPMEDRQFEAPNGHFVVVYAGGAAVACGGWRSRDRADDPDLDDGDAEIKRMYVVPTHRGRGYARGVLAELERTARAAGRRRAVLETGTIQPAAIALYTSAGYRPIGNFGVYRKSPNSRCFGRSLTVVWTPEGGGTSVIRREG